MPVPQVRVSFPLAFWPDECQYIDMVCPHCSNPTDVVNSRKQRRTNAIWRRRRCTSCQTVFTTLEGIDLQSVLRVAQTPTALQPFSRDRLFISIYESCKHRPTALMDASNLTQQVITLLTGVQTQPGLIDRVTIIQTVHRVLKRFDKAAATYYAAYHLL